MTSSRLVIFGSGVLAGSVAASVASWAPFFKPADKETPKEKRGKEILKYGSPSGGPVERYYENHVLQYDPAKKIPSWVAEHLNQENLKGKANRRKVKFHPDPDVDSDFCASNGDYWNSGWSRGHMAPAGDNKCSQTAMEETFYLSNVLPQDIKNNAGFWNRFEMYCRDLTKKFENVRVISGPVMLPQQTEEGKKFIQYPVIGDSQVAVPTHLYKVIVAENQSGEEKAMAAFVVPNVPISFDHPLTEYKVPLHDVEKRTGFRFLPKLDQSTTKDLCVIDGCEMMNKDQYELFILERRLWSANDREKLDKVWKKLEEKQLKPTEDMQKTYEKKLAEFEKKVEEK